MKQTVDLSTLSADELKAELERRNQAEKAEREKQREDFKKDKNDFLKQTASKFKHLNRELKNVKEYTTAGANDLYERMYRMNDKEPKDTKSFSLKNEDDTLKVVVDRQERFEFTEEAMVHINAIKDIFKEKFANRNKGLYSILDGLLIKGSKGEYDPKLLAKARKQVRELGDENLIAEFDKLDDCQRITGTASYCRLYTRENGKWQDVTLQFSAL